MTALWFFFACGLCFFLGFVVAEVWEVWRWKQHYKDEREQMRGHPADGS